MNAHSQIFQNHHHLSVPLSHIIITATVVITAVMLVRVLRICVVLIISKFICKLLFTGIVLETCTRVYEYKYWAHCCRGACYTCALAKGNSLRVLQSAQVNVQRGALVENTATSSSSVCYIANSSALPAALHIKTTRPQVKNNQK